MRVVVVGASGNVGTSLLAALGNEPAVESVLGVARRMPRLDAPKVEWASGVLPGPKGRAVDETRPTEGSRAAAPARRP
jgi:uncharacterized protein YbjT (DUF2867 family)